MSLITRCPTCETMFRVVPDQLRVSEGWVRCGQCAEVFDATQNMVPPLDETADGAVPASPVPASPATAAKPPTPTPTPAAPAHTQPPVAAERQAGSPHAAVDHGNAPAPHDATRRGATDVAQEPHWLDEPQTDPQTAILPTDDADPVADDAPAPVDPDFPPMAPPQRAGDAEPPIGRPQPADIVPTPSFLQEEPPPSIWRRPIVRLTLAVVLVLLLALLAMQILVKERDRVAAMHPAMRPMLEAMCVMADCRIGPPRQIESIVIDSSTFSRVRGDDYRLGFALKNTAPIDVAMPAIELSLTDPQDQPVIRRVILPTEFGARSAALASASTWTGSLALTVQPDIGTQRVAGYRLLAFYP